MRLADEIQDLRKGKELLEEVWLMTNASDSVNYELTVKVNKYLFGKAGTNEIL